MEFTRSSGILAHPTSFPGHFGIGDIGPEAYKFIDFLKSTGQKLWQILPLGPTGYGNSPYACYSAFAGNPNLISPEILLEEGFLDQEDLQNIPNFSDKKVDYISALAYKSEIYKKAFANFKERLSDEEKESFFNFCNTNDPWLQDFALFMAIKENYEYEAKSQNIENKFTMWSDWDLDLVLRKPQAINQANEMLGDQVFYHKFLQYQFFKQWQELKSYANQNGISIVGDIPIFVAYDSADVWSNPEIFQLDNNGLPIEVAGVPPDYFSETGQLWGNPLYDWDMLVQTNFDWWINRFKMILQLVDIVRVDHFRGFEAYWAIPYGAKTAINGKWKKALGVQLFQAIESTLGKLPMIAEDLGLITPEVEALRDQFNFPGMKIVQFAFTNTSKDPFLPHNYTKNCVVYPGTHDNDTCWGWFNTAPEAEKNYLLRYAGANGEHIHWDFIRLAMSSIANISIYAIQDVMGLDTASRMNMPSKPDGNWEWRYTDDMLTQQIHDTLANMTADYGR